MDPSFDYATPTSINAWPLDTATTNVLASFDEAASQIGAPGTSDADLPGLQQKLDAAQAFVDGDGSASKHYFRVRQVEATFGRLPAGVTRVQLPRTFLHPTAVSYSNENGAFNPVGGVTVHGDAAYLALGEADLGRLALHDEFTVSYTTALDDDPVLKEIVLRLTGAWFANRGDDAGPAYAQAERQALVSLTAFMDARRDSV